nr:amidohydrolase family protein [Chryseosolibacter indicus]
MNLKIFLLLTLIFFASIAKGQQPVDNVSREVVFLHVNVITMDSDKILEDQTVIVRNGKIKQIGNSKSVKYPKNAFIVNSKDKYLIPGLAEMHAHVPPIDDITPMKEVLTLFVANGITTIRGMLGHPKHLELRSKINSSEILGPHFYTTGPSFNGMSVRSAEEGAAMVRKQKEAGYDYLKLHPGLSREKFDAIASTAKEVGIPFVGHVSFGVGVWHAIESRYSSIDHMDGFIEGLVPGINKMVEQQTGLFGMNVADKVDTTRIPELIQQLKQNNIWVVPTQSLAERWFHPDYTAEVFKADPNLVYMKPETIEQWVNSKQNLVNNPTYNPDRVQEFVALRRKLILKCQRNGVGLLLGCDAPQIFNVPGFSTHQELQYLVLSGLTPYEALRAGTVNVAKYLGKSDSGIIREDAVADLVLLNGNPLVDIKQTQNIAGVMLGNKWLGKKHLDDELKKLRKK